MTYIRCPHCGAKALNVATICPHCRTPLTQNPMEAGPHGLEPCHRCKKFIERDTEICPFCSYPVRRGRSIRRAIGIGSAVTVLLLGGGLGFAAVGGFGGIAEWFRGARSAPVVPPAIAIPSPAEPDTITAPALVAAPPGPAVVRAPLPNFTVRYARNWANVRSGRNTDSTVVAVLRPGDRVQVADPVGGWWAVWADTALVGYVATDLLSTTPVDSLP